MTTVGIIGAGPAGLVAAKSVREEGLHPVVFDQASQIGGLWRAEGGKAWAGMRTNVSRYTCMFSDFPWPDGHDLFPTQADMAAYLNRYATAFGLNSCLRLGEGIEKVRQTKTGRWILTTRDDRIRTVDHLIVASGFFSEDQPVTLPGRDKFEGDVVHSSAFTSPQDFRNRKVIVVGGSFSGCEIAAELAQAGTDVTHVLRNPVWVIPPTVPATNMPIDLMFYRRKSSPPQTFLERNQMKAQFLEATFGNPGNSHPSLRLDPEDGNPVYVAVSASYLEMVRRRKISVKITTPDALRKNSMELKIGSTIAADTVIMATGYRSNLEFFSGDVQRSLAYDPEDSFIPALLHKATLPAIDNLGFVGFYRGPYMGIMELQARWLAGMMSGRLSRPGLDEIAAGLEQERRLRDSWPRPQFPHDNYVAFADDFARALGVMPDLHGEDRDLVDNPVIPSQYRLQGPHANREVALRVIKSLPRYEGP